MDKSEVRKTFPTCCAWADGYREVFGEGTKLLYAKEGGHVIGHPLPNGVATATDNGDLSFKKKTNK